MLSTMDQEETLEDFLTEYARQVEDGERCCSCGDSLPEPFPEPEYPRECDVCETEI